MIKTTIRKFVNSLPPSWSRIPLSLVYYVVNGKEVFSLYRQLNSYNLEALWPELTPFERNRLKCELRKYCLYMNRSGARNFLESYMCQSDFRCLQRRTNEAITSDDVILICCVKNDIHRIQALYYHHLDIGVKNFVFVDNGSTDGTVEWLLAQGVDVYQTDESYHAGAKAAWCRRIWDIYGYDRWYLILDSDELFSYPGMEKHPIGELIEYARQNSIQRVRALLLDMYSDKPLFQGAKVYGADFTQEYRFFDKDTYYCETDCRGLMIRGGPRKRVFEAQLDHAQPQTKYPLLFVQFEDLWADHTPLPFEKNFSSDCLSVLRHYKFLPEDQEKFRKIVENGNYSNGSSAYRNYMKVVDSNREVSFFGSESVEFLDSDSLCAIPHLKSVFD